MPRYVDGFVLPIPKRNFARYRRMAQKAGRIWKEHGALEYCECVGEDMRVPCGIRFPKLAKARKGEAVWFSFIVYKSRRHRDAVIAKVIQDPRLQSMMDPKAMPFDMQRMASGGFEIVVDL